MRLGLEPRNLPSSQSRASQMPVAGSWSPHEPPAEVSLVLASQRWSGVVRQVRTELPGVFGQSRTARVRAHAGARGPATHNGLGGTDVIRIRGLSRKQAVRSSNGEQ